MVAAIDDGVMASGLRGHLAAATSIAMPSIRTLLLLRHAKSSWDDPTEDDFDRRLSTRGRRAAQAIARELAKATVQPDIILCSAARRTRETLDAILPHLTKDHLVQVERGLYLADVDTLQSVVRRLPARAGCVLVIGHNPGLHDFADALSGAGDQALRERLSGKFPTGALATIEIAGPWSKAAAGAGRLVGFVVPRDLA